MDLAFLFTKRIGFRTGLLYAQHNLLGKSTSTIVGCDNSNNDFVSSFSVVSKKVNYVGIPLGIEAVLLSGKNNVSIIPGYELLLNVKNNVHSAMIVCDELQSNFSDTNFQNDDLDAYFSPQPIQNRIKLGIEYSRKIGTSSEIVIRPQAKFGLNPVFKKGNLPDMLTVYINNSKQLTYGINLGYRRVFGQMVDQ